MTKPCGNTHWHAIRKTSWHTTCLGTALRETDESGAAAQYRQALELGPNERNIYDVDPGKAHNGLGDIAARKGDVADAIAHYEQALESDPNFVPAHMNLGSLLANNGNFDEAMVHFQRSIELSPDNAAAYCNLAVALAQQGKTDEAIANLRKALEIDPNLGTGAHRTSPPFLPSEMTSTKRSFIFAERSKSTPTLPFPTTRWLNCSASKEKRARPPSMTSGARRPAAVMPKPRTSAAPNWPNKAKSTRRLPNFRRQSPSLPIMPRLIATWPTRWPCRATLTTRSRITARRWKSIRTLHRQNRVSTGY